jgi:hypothetical protein
MLDFTLENISAEDVERLRALYEPLVESTTTRVDGVKTFAVGHLPDEDGVTVEADGVFILPRWAQDHSD